MFPYKGFTVYEKYGKQNGRQCRMEGSRILLLQEEGLRGWGEDLFCRRWDPLDRDLYPDAFPDRHIRHLCLDFLEVCLPMKGLADAFIAIGVVVIAENGLLSVLHFYDPFHGCFCRIVCLIVRIGIVVIVIPIGLAPHAEVQELEGDDDHQGLP